MKKTIALATIAAMLGLSTCTRFGNGGWINPDKWQAGLTHMVASEKKDTLKLIYDSPSYKSLIEGAIADGYSSEEIGFAVRSGLRNKIYFWRNEAQKAKSANLQECLGAATLLETRHIGYFAVLNEEGLQDYLAALSKH